MKAIVQIIRKDTTAIVKNYAACIVVIALCILPSLYAWFNIKASWDPYSQNATRGIKIGVVNLDEGTMLQEQPINIGNKVIDGLKENTQLGWQFTDETTARQAIEDGTYYAVITIPKNFSKDLTSILSTEIKESEIIYTINEKLNAIAPKLTEKGVSGLQEVISKEVVTTVSKAIFEVANEVGINLEEQIPRISEIYQMFLEFQGKFGDIESTVTYTESGVIRLKSLLEELKNELPNIKSKVENAKSFSANLKEFISSSQDATTQLSPVIKQDLKIIYDLSKEIDGKMESLKNAVINGVGNEKDLVAQMSNKVSSLKQFNDSVMKFLTTLNALSPAKPLQGVISSLEQTSNDLANALTTIANLSKRLEDGGLIDVSFFDRLQKVTESVKRVTGSIYDNFDVKIAGKIEEILGAAFATADDAIEILDKAEQKLPEVSNLLDIASNSAMKGQEGIDYVKKILPKLEDMINDIVNKVGSTNTEKELQELVKLLKADVEKRADFLANPVSIKEEKLFPMENYGTSMTPFYTILCLWVGCLLLVSILRVETTAKYRPNEVYFGKLALFVGIAMVQALIVSLGDLYLLKIYCMNKGWFVLSNMYVACIFAIIVYSLVSIFGNVGKVIAIILLVLQVAGSGGTFPIQLTPKFFQSLYPFLPFTYGIGLAREMIGGIVLERVIKDILVLASYGLLAILLSVFLKRPINQLLHRFVERFHESELGE